MRPLFALVIAFVAALALIVVIGITSTALRSAGVIAAIPTATARATATTVPTPTVVAAKPTLPPTATAAPTLPPPTPTTPPRPTDPPPIAVPTSVPPTAVPPTSAPAPTDVPTAVPTPEPTAAPAAPPKPAPKPTGPSPETQAYLDWLGPKTEIAAQGLRALSTQSSLAGQNPRLLTDNDWRMRTGMVVALLQTNGQAMQAYPHRVPSEAQKLDDMVKDLGRDLVYIANEYTAGVDQLSTVRLNNATSRMNTIPTKTRAATAEIQAIRGQ